MYKFVKKICIFSIPFMMLMPIIAWFIYIGYETGELVDIDKAIEFQRDVPDTLLGLAYNEQNSL